MEKMKMHSNDLTQENIARIREAFPGCVTEARDEKGNIRLAVDFDLLRQELSDSIVEGPQERYHLNWPGKREALLTANAPVARTMRPDRDESVDFDTTKNLFIEGDNLDALKLLQETYLGKVKMIYIDPPYNTGNNFIYEDDFVENTEEFLKRSNQKDEYGNRLVSNTASNGKFHSDWLSMMYPRLKLSRDLLCDEGLIVISIDENEAKNLCKICDEIFGEENFLFQITVLCNPKGRSQDKYIANSHEYLVGYSKNQLNKGDLNIPKSQNEIAKNYKLKDHHGAYRELELRNTHREFGLHNRPNLYYPFFVKPDGTVSIDSSVDAQAVFPDWDDGFQGCWTWGLEKAKKKINEIVAHKVKGKWKIYRKNYAIAEEGEATKQVKSIWSEKEFHTEKGQAVFNDLFDTKDKVFQSPKSIETLKQLLMMGVRKNSIILDFFAGSASMAHAVIDFNAVNGGNHRFFMVQLPEQCDETSAAFKEGYKTVAEIGKERIRRAGKKILDGECHENWNKDVGFRVLKIDSSNMEDVYYTPDEIKQGDLKFKVDSVKPDRTSEDLLFQVLLDWGVDLTLPIRKEKITVEKSDANPRDPNEYEVFFVDENALIACFDQNIAEDLVKELAGYNPLRVVFRDTGFVNDAARINVEQIFKQMSPSTEVKAI